MKRILKNIIKMAKYKENSISPLINITISRKALLHNIGEFKRFAPNGQIAPVLKSNAYGHGINVIAKELDKHNFPFFVVDSFFEAKALRNESILTPLLIIGYTNVDTILKNYLKNVNFTITNLDTLKELSEKIDRNISIHIKIDTGMHRQGISVNEIDVSIGIIKSKNKIKLIGISSHLSDADNSDKAFTIDQISLWNNTVKKFRREFPDLRYWHISASSGHIYREVNANISRLGIGMYGLIDLPELDIQPILEMKTIITSIKKIKSGDTVGYNNTFTANRDMIIATIPVGYNEGIDRRLSNKGYIKYDNTFCPILGRVSMNITVIDISKVRNAKIGDEVIIFSSNKSDKNSIINIAKICETITYEIAIHIPQYLKRIMV